MSALRPVVEPAVHAYAIERAEHRLRSCLRWLARGELDVDRVASVLARLLSCALPAERLVPGVQRWTGLDEAGAREVIEAYARALDEHARAVRYHARWRRESARGREHEAIARACEEHAGRVIAAVPYALVAE